MEQGKRKLSETVLVHCTDVRVLLERLLWWNEAWIWYRALRERVSELFTYSLCKCQPYASLTEPPAYILQNGAGRKTFPLFVCLAAELHHNLRKVWSTLKLKELPSFVRVADLKAKNLTTGIGTHDGCVILQPLEQFVARMHLLDVHWVPILRKNLKLNTMCLTTMRLLLRVSLCALTLQPTQPWVFQRTTSEVCHLI